MKRLILIGSMLALAFMGSYAQEPKVPLPAQLQGVKTINIFPENPEKQYVFRDAKKAVAPSAFSIVKQADGSRLLTAEVFARPDSHFGINTVFKTAQDIRKGDVLLARFSVRSIYAKQESGDAVVYFYMNAKDTRVVLTEIAVGNEWKNYDIPFVANVDVPKGEGEICFSFGALVQKVEILDVEVLNFGTQANLADMPTTRFTYGGREAGARWRKEALERIEKLRTAPIVVQVTDEAGKAVKGAKVEVDMVMSDFIWGSAVKEVLLGDELPDSDRYKAVLTELFNTAVPENGFKSPRWEDEQRRAQTKRAFEWVEKAGLRQRGHNLVWPGWKFNSKWLRELAQRDTTAFRQEIEKQIREKMAYTKGRVIAWDVIRVR